LNNQRQGESVEGAAKVPTMSLSKHKSNKSVISVGPWGGNGGSPWDDGDFKGIRQIVIVHAGAIDSIRIEYDKNGRSIWSDKHGGNGGDKTDKIVLDYPREHLTSMSGHYGSVSVGSACVIRSLTFHSNLRKFGPYGVENGTFFSFPMDGGKIKGFHGRSGWFLDSIGVHLSHNSQNTFWSTIKGSARNLLRS
ncbi:hypothetical protein KI387_007116, partial [Taxus chinensis]